MKQTARTYIFSAVIAALLLFVFLQATRAETMSNTSYIIQWGNFNSIAGTAQGSGTTLSFTSGETAPGLYTGTNFKIRSGFQYVHTIIPFMFSLSSTEISFGDIEATYPVDRNNFLTVSNGSAYGFQVTAQENHALFSPGIGSYIPNTTCDNGLCTSTTSDAWTVTSSVSNTFGFGYRCDDVSGTTCASGFGTSTYFKQFAASPSAEIVMQGTNVGRNLKTQITYRVNVSGTQPAGTYTNQIQYIATPTF
ncbi:MAG TPA: hypothetical protein VN711_04465 [Candidatus Saccharimonadales bacterium]|nr:hypothetical protein [Candidatus Saccharimonadales bacterium]